MHALSFVRRDPAADVLVVTNMWPEPDRPVYGIHVRRQVESLIAAGLCCEIVYVRGYESPLAYPLAALSFLTWSVTRRRRYKLVHVYTAEAALAARFYLGAPMIATYLGDDLLGDRRADGTISMKARLRARLLRAHARLMTRSIVVSGVMQRALPPAARARSSVIPQGIDSSVFRPQEKAKAREAFGWQVGEKVALFAATKPHSPAKRLWLAEEACARASESVGPVRLHVAAGVDPETIPLLMNASDCLLVTSAVEGSPNVVKEALMCNLPVVSTPAGDIDELLAGVEPSWLVPPVVEELAVALVECLSRGGRSNGREAAAELDERLIAKRIVAFYREVADVRTGAPAV